MKSNRPLYFIRGSGYSLDGSLVTIESEVVVDDKTYCVVNPIRTDIAVGSVLIDKRYLQTSNINPDLRSYTIVVSKYNKATNQVEEQDTLHIENALRDVSVTSILERLNKDLAPILRLER